MSVRALVLRYSLFALVATVANLATQRAILQYDASNAVFALAVGTGTVVGLVIKYALDKRWIFYDIDTGLTAHGRKFSLYAGAGILTTCIFWGFETLFWVIWQTDTMRELGAVLGLAIGYVVKYGLDRRYVFTGPLLPQGAAK